MVWFRAGHAGPPLAGLPAPTSLVLGAALAATPAVSCAPPLPVHVLLPLPLLQPPWPLVPPSVVPRGLMGACSPVSGGRVPGCAPAPVCAAWARALPTHRHSHPPSRSRSPAHIRLCPVPRTGRRRRCPRVPRGSHPIRHRRPLSRTCPSPTVVAGTCVVHLALLPAEARAACAPPVAPLPGGAAAGPEGPTARSASLWPPLFLPPAPTCGVLGVTSTCPTSEGARTPPRLGVSPGANLGGFSLLRTGGKSVFQMMGQAWVFPVM